ncbi:S8 family serine peptidase [Microbacterium hominis]|uniref:S8 family serine peptidase n=1 Tax=Microbacterium hominis TaxID=162426 RepID=A0A7D4Q3A0_9MICO|nr:S8 family serine peptidase [Microbacterium hominis]QKJ20812.1 S8 family serine peptidase [Microbacterium hominis]
MQPSSSRPRRLLAATVAGCALVGAGLTGTAAVAADPAAPALTGSPALLSGASAGGTAVTLITGDTAYLTTDADGGQSVFVRGAGGESTGDVFTRTVEGDVYAIPVDALDAIGDDRLDLELFNVSGLVRQGYDDAGRTSLPVIVSGTVGVIEGTEATAELESIDATAVTIDKESAAEAFEALMAGGADVRIALDALMEPAVVPAAAGAASTSVMLDPRTGVEQTGAPKAWASGYTGEGVRVAVLDTGWDSSHPDLADHVVAEKDFTGSGATADQVGHGTHVAGTVAGDGTADVSRVGMAPDADLIIGKVLGPNGGSQSSIIEGMEWAVAQGADIVNMSLGSQVPAPCEDPVEAAVEALSDQALFVISAGNLSTRTSVTSPGCAPEALTVGAVDANGDVASFSSRGAVMGDHRVKPDISAPGVDIVSAWANGTGGVKYRSMSGTSMAAPHVAGAAALVAQAHPEWTGDQIKRALAAGVKTGETSTVYEEGAGELWVPGAIAATVTSDVSVSVGTFAWPHGADQKASTPVTYQNSGSKAVQLSFRVDDVTGADGARVPSSLIRVSPQTVTIPAGGSVEVTVSARGDVGTLATDAYGEISARVIATANGKTASTTAVGMWLAPQTTTVDFEVIDRNGAPASVGLFDLVDRHAPARGLVSLASGIPTEELRVGTYTVGAYVRTTVDGQRTWTYVSVPELEITGSTTKVTLDARDAVPITVDTPRPMKIVDSQFGTEMSWDRWGVESYLSTTGADLFVTPTARVKDGEFGFAVTMRGVDPSTSIATSPYIYNLVFATEHGIDAAQNHVVREKDLATVTESWHGELGPLAMLDVMTVRPAGWTTDLVGLSVPVNAPAQRTAYYTAGATWQQSASESSRLPAALWVDPERTYTAGQETSVDWYKLRSRTGTLYRADGSPGRVAERQGTLIGFSFPQWQDTVAGRYAIAGFREVGNTAVWVDGVYRGVAAFPYAQLTVGEGAHDVSVRIINTKLGSAPLSSTTYTVFSFSTDEPADGAIAALPVVFPRYDAAVDEFNRAPRDSAFEVTIGSVGQDGYDPGEWASLSVRMASTPIVWDVNNLPGESPSWVDVPVVERDGEWVALIDQADVPVNSKISLAVEGVDAHGAQVEQYVFDLYQVP